LINTGDGSVVFFCLVDSKLKKLLKSQFPCDIFIKSKIILIQAKNLESLNEELYIISYKKGEIKL